ncbi:S1 RNA-binding domain-containing protein [Paenibacillus sp. Leaf72]|uniref:S1 RNA-binding domain-containing protein n=1 Tax=Paenibacillus sp. Leaf72 TaxID=1736234 RepID=UPI0006FC8D3D|nr:S1 RNA-binding domain-containing protein [Paenibacillus sp. Leaf72]KQN96874.1 hypothetical protein ASF12_22660 [Paenibacillus sp. Leaf72]
MNEMKQFNETDVLAKAVEIRDDNYQKQSEQESWEKVYQARQNRSIMQSELRGTETHGDKLCGIVFVGHIKGLIPLEHSGYEKAYQLEEVIGQNIYYKVTNLDRESEMFTASRSLAVDHLQGLSWDILRENRIFEAAVVRVNNRSVKLDIGAIITDLPIEEVSYGWVSDLHSLYKIGSTIHVKVMKVDKETKTLIVSVKALKANPWPECTRRYQKNNTYTGVVSGVVEYGVFVNLEEGVDVLCPHPKPNIGRVKLNDRVKVRIKDVNVEESKMTAVIKDKL